MEKEDYAKSILEYQEVKDTIEYEREYARNEGRAEGLAEAKLTMAKSMLGKGIEIETIISITGLTAEEIMSNWQWTISNVVMTQELITTIYSKYTVTEYDFLGNM